jgi:endogenous inhibitor of DNA gyrase (YacG/DUF329 family)
MYNGFYFYYNPYYKNYECIKIFETGDVKRIIYNNSIDEIVDKLFFIENIPIDKGVICNKSFIQFYSNNGPIFYNCVNHDSNTITFNIQYPNGANEMIIYEFYETKHEVICKLCDDKIEIALSTDNDVFRCKRCRTIYSYEWVNGELKITSVLKKIPPDIKEILEYFGYDKTEINKDELKTKHNELIKKYHPDRFDTFPPEDKNRATEKTKEIINNWEKVKDFIIRYENCP